MQDAFFEKAKTWDQRPQVIEMSRLFAEELQKNITLQKDFDLLEFGCGTGQVGLRFHDQVHSLLMVDNSPAMLNVLKEKIAAQNIMNINILEGDITTLKITESSIDMIFSLMAFHHVNNIPEVLQTFYSVLKPGGLIAIGDLVAEDGSFHQGEQVAHHGFDLDELANTFSSNGYSVQKKFVFRTMQRPDAEGTVKEYQQFMLIAQKQ